MATAVLVVGSGAREHALVWALGRSSGIGELYCAPGNAGTAGIATNLSIRDSEIDRIVEAVEEYDIDLSIVGPEAPLAAGLADRLREAGRLVFGPNQAAARIESSKAWAKEIMSAQGIPTGMATTVADLEEAEAAIHASGEPLVVKADGLAAGKGVFVCDSREEARERARELLEGRELGEAGATVLIEEYLEGMEVSLLAVTDGEAIVPLVPACDYKRVGEGDSGPNTGGMGAYAPPGSVSADLVQWSVDAIFRPALEGMRERGAQYQGVLYAGMILTPDGPKVLEFNCRFGDPEAQVVLPLLESDFLEMCLAAAEGRLGALEPLRWVDGACVGVVLASGGYPGRYETGHPISGLDALPEGGIVFHAGTTVEDGDVVTTGGRVLTAVGCGPSMSAARELAYRTAGAISFTGVYRRDDIALRETAG